MDLIQLINTRRSVRSYKSKKIDDQDIEKIVSAGMHAPSANNQQPWQFIVITDPKTLADVTAIHPHAQMSKNAPLAILTCYDKTLEQTPDFWVQDCSAATQNMMLAAHSLNIGSVWTGVYPRNDIVDGFKKLFDLPENIIPFSYIVFGYAKKEEAYENRYKMERVHTNKW